MLPARQHILWQAGQWHPSFDPCRPPFTALLEAADRLCIPLSQPLARCGCYRCTIISRIIPGVISSLYGTIRTRLEPSNAQLCE